MKSRTAVKFIARGADTTWMAHSTCWISETNKHWKCRSFMLLSTPSAIHSHSDFIPMVVRNQSHTDPHHSSSNQLGVRIKRNETHHPKSAGNDVNDMSFNPSIVRLLSCEKPAGSLEMGLELKSAIWSSRRWRMSSGMSCMSKRKGRECH